MLVPVLQPTIYATGQLRCHKVLAENIEPLLLDNFFNELIRVYQQARDRNLPGKKLEDEVRQQGAQRDVCDAETLEGIFRQTLLACAVD